MNPTRRRQLFLAMLAIVGGSFLVEPGLRLIGAPSGWIDAVGYVPIVGVFAALGCFVVLYAQRFRPEVRAYRREVARRDGRTIGFYVGSIAAVILFVAVVIVLSGLFVRDRQLAQLVLSVSPVVFGACYLAWYRVYQRRAAARYDAEHADP